MDKMESLIKEIISDKLGLRIEEITLQASIVNDLGADSLDEVEILMSLEDEFDIEISDDEAQKINTIKEVVDLITEKV